MLRLVILTLLGIYATQVAAGSVGEKMMQKINKYNLLARCWGDDLMVQYAVKIHKSMEFCEEIQTPMFGPTGGLTSNLPIDFNQLEALQSLLANPAIASLLRQPQAGQAWKSAWEPFLAQGRRKREAGLLNPTQEDQMEFLEDISEFKESWMTKISNLTCVLTQLEMLDAAGNINMNTYGLKSAMSLLSKSPAGSDPAFLKKLTDGFSDCHDISRNWPQTALDRNPITQKYGRHMIFFECAKKVEDVMCAKFQMSKWVEVLYGKFDPTKWGLPEDKYDAAAMALKVQDETASEESKMVDEFFWGKSKFQ